MLFDWRKLLTRISWMIPVIMIIMRRFFNCPVKGPNLVTQLFAAIWSFMIRKIFVCNFGIQTVSWEDFCDPMLDIFSIGSKELEGSYLLQIFFHRTLVDDIIRIMNQSKFLLMPMKPPNLVTKVCPEYWSSETVFSITLSNIHETP